MPSVREEKSQMMRLIEAGMVAADHADLFRGHYVVTHCTDSGYELYCLGDEATECDWREKVKAA